MGEDLERRLRLLEEHRRESSRQHDANRVAFANLDHKVSQIAAAQHESGEERRAQHATLLELVHAQASALDEQRETIRGLEGQTAELVAINLKAAEALAERQRMAERVGVWFKVGGAIVGFVAAVVGFVKLVWELARHK